MNASHKVDDVILRNLDVAQHSICIYAEHMNINITQKKEVSHVHENDQSWQDWSNDISAVSSGTKCYRCEHSDISPAIAQ